MLMIGSIFLLAAFEFFWLRSEYRDQQQLLQEQQTHRFHSAIRELEDSLFQVRLWTPLNVDKDSIDCRIPRMRIAHHGMAEDTAKLFTIIRSVEVGGQDSIKMHARRVHKGSMMLGNLSGQILAAGDSSMDAGKLGALISEKLSEVPSQQTDLGFRLISWQEEQPEDAGLTSRSYFDMSSGTHYALEYPEFKGYLFQRILPQILFAILLFTCISGAFWMISKNMRRQRRLAEVRSNLISNITHELKTPISTVHVALEALQNFDADTDRIRRHEYLDIAQSEVNRLAILVDKVLKTSGLENAHAPLKIESFDLRDLVTHVLDTLKVQFGKLSAHVAFEVSGEDFTLEADKLHITGLVHNLIDNALKYGGTNPEIGLQLSQQNGKVTIAVSDHGAGIPKEYQARIFEKFFRVPSGDTHNIKGHGLGLSYVADVVHEHGGTIEVSSTEGTGSKFTVTLPRTHAN